MAFPPAKGRGRGKGTYVFHREITARNLADADRRMGQFMAENPSFIFRPREDVPEELTDVYAVLGENGPQLWKNLRHHLAHADGIKVGGRILQFIAERSKWRIDKLNHVERNRTVKKQKDKLTSRMTIYSGEITPVTHLL